MVKNKKKKKLLIYAHYYIPDVASTGQILKELAEGILDHFEVTVICVVPSYTGKVAAKYKKKWFYKEELNGVKIIRVRVPEFTKSNKVSRVKNILTYFFGSMIATFKVGAMDYVYSISQPPILGGLLGLWGKYIKSAKYIYNIQDFNPEQTMAIGFSKNKVLLNLMFKLDNLSCRYSDKVIVVGRDMVDTLKKRNKHNKVPNHVFINNWIDEKEIYPLPAKDSHVLEFKRKYGLEDKFIIMYSGNIGLYYDLKNLLKVIENFKTIKDVAFVFIGEGTIKSELVHYKVENNLENVTFIPYQNKENLVYSLNAGDVHWCINARGIKGVSVPSKLYGIIAAGKPILGVLEEGSEARLIIEETNCGYVTEPGNYSEVEDLIRRFIQEKETPMPHEMGQRGREYLLANLTKDVSIEKYISEIISC